jgi:hypothetical protein
LTDAFVTALQAQWTDHGDEVLAEVRKKSPEKVRSTCGRTCAKGNNRDPRGRLVCERSGRPERHERQKRRYVPRMKLPRATGYAVAAETSAASNSAITNIRLMMATQVCVIVARFLWWWCEVIEKEARMDLSF